MKNIFKEKYLYICIVELKHVDFLSLDNVYFKK